jgi:integrase
VDQQIGAAKTVVNKAFDNDMVSGETIKVFRRVKGLLKATANARDRILAPNEFTRLLEHLPPIVATAFYTGMRRNGVLSLTWGKVDLAKSGFAWRPPTQRIKSPALYRFPRLFLVF